MPRYFLTVRCSDRVIIDPDGSEFADLASALNSARDEAKSLSSDNFRGGEEPLVGEIDVIDETGAVVATIPLEEI